MPPRPSPANGGSVGCRDRGRRAALRPRRFRPEREWARLRPPRWQRPAPGKGALQGWGPASPCRDRPGSSVSPQLPRQRSARSPPPRHRSGRPRPSLCREVPRRPLALLEKARTGRAPEERRWREEPPESGQQGLLRSGPQARPGQPAQDPGPPRAGATQPGQRSRNGRPAPRHRSRPSARQRPRTQGSGAARGGAQRSPWRRPPGSARSRGQGRAGPAAPAALARRRARPAPGPSRP